MVIVTTSGNLAQKSDRKPQAGKTLSLISARIKAGREVLLVFDSNHP